MKVIKPNKIKVGELNENVKSSDCATIFSKLSQLETESFQCVKSEREGALLECEMHPFVQALHIAFSDHLPVNINPDMIWYLVSSGVASHVNINSEELRNKFVSHDDKKRIEVRRDDFVINRPNPWNEVIDEFCVKIGENTKAEIADIMQANFSTTTKDARVVSQIVLMDSMQKYFAYVLVTRCGIPEIRVHGTRDDWEKLIAKTKRIVEIIPELSQWLTILELRVLSNFLKVFDSDFQMEEEFWNSIYKVRYGSGGPYVSGWVVFFFPYLKNNGKNSLIWDGYSTNLPIMEQFQRAFTTNQFCYNLSKVPFIWEYYELKIEMQLLGGLVAVHYDERDKSLTPVFGYAVAPVGETIHTNDKVTT